MRSLLKSIVIPTFTLLALFLTTANSLKHNLVLTNDQRRYFSVSSFGYLRGGRLVVEVDNLTLNPDPSDEDGGPHFGFMLFKTDQPKNPIVIEPDLEKKTLCMIRYPNHFFSYNIITLAPDPKSGKVIVRCIGDGKLPTIESLSHRTDPTRNRRAVVKPSSDHSLSSEELIDTPELRKEERNSALHSCEGSEDLPLTIHLDEFERRSYSFNFTMLIRNQSEEAQYYLTFHNCHGRRVAFDHHGHVASTRVNLTMNITETNFLDNYLSAGLMPLPQMYFVLSVMFFLIGLIWLNFIRHQKDNTLKIHHLMTVLVFAKACSLMFHGINNHNIAVHGQPVVTWAYLYYATRSVKGALFFITLALIGSGWSFIKHILSDKDKKIILVIVALQVIAHVAEIVLDESSEGQASNEFWSELCGIVDLFSCMAILFPIGWSVRHLEEASRTDGKAAINLKKLELFKKFYIISTVFIYITRIVTFVFLLLISYRYSWLAELASEFSTLIYFIITGYYFQPMPTNPYLLLSSDTDMEEDILFSVDAHEPGGGTQLDELDGADDDSLLSDGRKKVVRRVVEEIV